MIPTDNHSLLSLATLRLRKPAASEVRTYAKSLAENGREPKITELLLLATSDPLLAVWILKQANNAYYGMRSTVGSLKKAFDILGAHTVAGMIAETSGSDEQHGPDHTSRDSLRAERNLIRHAVATAMIAAKLGGEDVSGAGPIYTAGLLHDVGKHLICHNSGEKAEGVYSDSSLWDQIKGTDLHTVEQLAFGVNHSEAAEFLARKMYFPESLTIILGHNSSPDPTTHTPEQHPHLWIVHASSMYASAAGYAAGKRVSINQCLSNPLWQALIDDRLVAYQSKPAMMDDLRTLSMTLSTTTNADDFSTGCQPGEVRRDDLAPTRNSKSKFQRNFPTPSIPADSATTKSS